MKLFILLISQNYFSPKILRIILLEWTYPITPQWAERDSIS